MDGELVREVKLGNEVKLVMDAERLGDEKVLIVLVPWLDEELVCWFVWTLVVFVPCVVTELVGALALEVVLL